MSPSLGTERLSAEDAMFLYLDTRDMPLHIASVMVFDGEIPLQDCRRLIASKLPLLRRYRQRVVFPPLNLGHPAWESDARFDIDNHITETRLEHGTDRELEELTGRILSQAMDRSKPLWDIKVVRGLKGGRGALICRVHHCLADGIAGIGLLQVILDSSPKASLPRVKQRPPAPAPKSDAPSPLIEGLLSSYSEVFDRMVSIQSYALNVAEAVLANGLIAVGQLFRIVPDLFGPFEGLPFNQPCQGARRLLWTEIPLAEINAIRDACGVKMNDVILSLVTTAIRRYSQRHHVAVKGRTLRMMVPVNIRGRDGIGGQNLGNRISLISVNVPLDIADPLKQLQKIHETTLALKIGGVPDMVGVLGNCLALMPTPLQAFLGPFGTDLPFPPWNMVCTNVPGPQIPLYALGRKMIAMYPYVPIGARMGLNCAVQSYDGKMFFGFSCSDAAVPDGRVMPKLLDAALVELRKRAGIAIPEQPEPRRANVRRNGHAQKRAEVNRASSAPGIPVPEPSVIETATPLAAMQA